MMENIAREQEVFKDSELLCFFGMSNEQQSKLSSTCMILYEILVYRHIIPVYSGSFVSG